MKLKFLFPFIFLYPINAFSWSDHTFTTFYTLEKVQSVQLQKIVQAETLQDFLIELKKNHPGEMKTAIENAEKWATQNMPDYHPIPTEIFYDENKVTNENIEKLFLEGIRVNPTALLFPYIRGLPSSHADSLWDKANEINYTQVTLPAIADSYVPGLRYFKISPAQSLPASVVLTSAADTPDLGLDIGLFEDNKTEFGKIYGFGKQPFGDSRVSFSSQAPFHYGAYHEWKIFYKLAPQTKDCYAEYRIKLYRELAKLAFATHHDYWGWRFLGFGLHYIQDLTQPYHTHFFPGYNTAAILAYYGLSLVGYESPLTNSINLIANRHFVLEDLVLKLLQNPQIPQSVELQNSLMQINNTETNLQYKDVYPRNVISLHSISYADGLSKSLVENLPEKYVSDPHFLYSDKKENILNTFIMLPAEQQKNVIETLKPILEYTGIYTRAYLKDFL